MDGQSILALLLIGIGVLAALREIAFLRSASVVPGRVVHIDKFMTPGEGGPVQMSLPVIEFIDDGGEARRMVDTFWLGAKRGNVRVAFIPGRSGKTRVYSLLRFWATPALLIGSGLLALFGPRL